MRLPSVPGPSDVLSAMGGVRDGFTEALELIPRVASAVSRVEGLLTRVSALLDRLDGIVDRAEGEIDGIGRTRAKADDAISAIGITQQKANHAISAVGATRQKADDAITAVGATSERAGGVVGRAEGVVGRIEPLIADYEPALTTLSPSVRRLASTLDPDEVEAMVKLIDRLPQLLVHLDEDILPVLESLGDVGTDVHDLVDTVQDMRQVVKGFPGSRMFRRRGAEEIAQDEQEEAAGR